MARGGAPLWSDAAVKISASRALNSGRRARTRARVRVLAGDGGQLQPTGTLTPIDVDARQDRNSRVCSAIKTAKSSLLQACGNHATQQLGQTGRGHSSEHEPPLPPQCVEPKQAHAIDLGRDRGQLSPGARLGRGGVRLNGSWLGSAIYPVDTAAVGLLREASLSPSFLRTTSAKNTPARVRAPAEISARAANPYHAARTRRVSAAGLRLPQRSCHANPNR